MKILFKKKGCLLIIIYLKKYKKVYTNIKTLAKENKNVFYKKRNEMKITIFDHLNIIQQLKTIFYLYKVCLCL